MTRTDTPAGHWWQIPLVLGLLGVITVGGAGVATLADDTTAVETAAAPTTADDAAFDDGEPTIPAAPTTSTTTTTVPLPPSEQRTLEPLEVIGGDIAPKSVVHSGDGYFIANNMMYRHTMTLYDRDMNLVATIPDTIELSEFGFDYEGEHQGAPVEIPGGHGEFRTARQRLADRANLFARQIDEHGIPFGRGEELDGRRRFEALDEAFPESAGHAAAGEETDGVIPFEGIMGRVDEGPEHGPAVEDDIDAVPTDVTPEGVDVEASCHREARSTHQRTADANEHARGVMGR